MKYVNQLQYPDMQYITQTANSDPVGRAVGLANTVAKSGCGLCSSVMVADLLRVDDGKFEVIDARQLSYDSGANHGVGTDGSILFPAFAEKFNLRYDWSKDSADLLRCLRTGGAAVIHASGDREGHVGLFTHRGHYIAAVSEERDGRIVILDPSYKEGKFEEEGRQGLVEVKNGVMAICDMQTILDNTVNRLHPFYLFWRK